MSKKALIGLVALVSALSPQSAQADNSGSVSGSIGKSEIKGDGFTAATGTLANTRLTAELAGEDNVWLKTVIEGEIGNYKLQTRDGERRTHDVIAAIDADGQVGQYKDWKFHLGGGVDLRWDGWKHMIPAGINNHHRIRGGLRGGFGIGSPYGTFQLRGNLRYGVKDSTLDSQRNIREAGFSIELNPKLPYISIPIRYTNTVLQVEEKEYDRREWYHSWHIAPGVKLDIIEVGAFLKYEDELSGVDEFRTITTGVELRGKF